MTQRGAGRKKSSMDEGKEDGAVLDIVSPIFVITTADKTSGKASDSNSPTGLSISRS